MNEQINFINEMATRYELLSNNADALYSALNELPDATFREILDEYSRELFRPVTLLRAEIARQRLKGSEISLPLVEEIKSKIREKDANYFSHLPAEFLVQLNEYPFGQRDVFANWQREWTLFHTFFYRAKVKETTQLYLDQIANALLKDLELADYKSHYVDFYGANNFGATYCWLSLYPGNKLSHQDARQLHVRFSGKTEAGRTDGARLKNHERLMRAVSDYADLLLELRQRRLEVIVGWYHLTRHKPPVRM